MIIKTKEEIIATISSDSELRKMFYSTKDESMRLLILKKINDQALLEEVAKGTNRFSKELRCVAVQKLKNLDVVASVALNDPSETVRMAAVPMINDEDILCEICLKDDYFVIKEAICNITKDEYLEKIVFGCDFSQFSSHAIDAIKDEKNLHRIIMKGNLRYYIGSLESVLRKITDKSLLKDIALNVTYAPVAFVASQILDDEEVYFRFICKYMGEDDSYTKEKVLSALRSIRKKEYIQKIYDVTSDWYIKKICDDNLTNLS